MDETTRVSLERYLNKEFPQWDIHIVTHGKEFSITGNGYTMDNAHDLWAYAENYLMSQCGWKGVKWSKPHY